MVLAFRSFVVFTASTYSVCALALPPPRPQSGSLGASPEPSIAVEQPTPPSQLAPSERFTPSEPILVRPPRERPKQRAGSLASVRWLLTTDRLSMLGSWNVTHWENDVKISENGEQLALVGGGAATGATVPINPHAVPRLSLDRVIGGSFSIGTGVAVYTQSGTWEASHLNLRAEGDGQSSWLFAISPRIGYFDQFSESIGFWGKFGASYAFEHLTNKVTSFTARVATLDLEGSMILRVVDHIGITPTFLLAFPLHGVIENNLERDFAASSGVSAHSKFDVELMVLALHLGMVGYW